MKVLYTSSDVHKAIKRIFKQSRSAPIRRIAVVAYLGVDAESFLPSPKGLRIICNPEPGATEPESIRALMAKGAEIKFSDKLHSKVYWSEKGCVIASANVSYRALGSSNQKETGIFIEAKEFDIDRLIQYVDPYEVTQDAMDKLEISGRKIKRATGTGKNSSSLRDYMTWYRSAYREPWKIGWCGELQFTASKSAIEKSSTEYGIKKPFTFMNVARNQVKSNEWLLYFEITDNGLKGLQWMYVDFVVSVGRTERDSYEKEYPYQAVQVRKLRFYPNPPFGITGEFRSAFRRAAKRYGIEQIQNSSKLKPKDRLLKYTAEYFSTL